MTCVAPSQRESFGSQHRLSVLSHTENYGRPSQNRPSSVIDRPTPVIRQQGHSPTQGTSMGEDSTEATGGSSGDGSGCRPSSTCSTDSGFDDGSTDCHTEEHHGCQHYRRQARLVAPCCSRVYTCRFCHDDEESHTMNRHEVDEMVCSHCETRQLVNQNCVHCHKQLGKYFCTVCRLHDDEEKKQFHCTQCGICRSGGRANFFHCESCDLCLPNHMKGNHKCLKGSGRSDCGVCLEDIHSSRTGGQVLPCGHLLHVTCFREMIKHRISTCPKCKESVKDRQREWARMDAEIRRSKVPSEFRHSFMEALCCDCHTTTRTQYHIIGLKCGKCGSYNTVPAGPLQRPSNSHGLSSIINRSIHRMRMMARVQ